MTSPVIRPAKDLELMLDQIEIPAAARAYNANAVLELSRSIEAIGLQSAPTVVEREGHFVLVAGRHRIAALKLLRVDRVHVRVVDFGEIEARMWTIAENLFRAELTALQRDQQVAEYARLLDERRARAEHHNFVADMPADVVEALSEPARGVEEVLPQQVAPADRVSAQLAPKPQGGRPESGDRAAARALGLDKDAVRRARIVDGLSSEAKSAAVALGVDDNRSALLVAAKKSVAEDQVRALHDIAKRGGVAAASDAKPLRNLINISAGEFARWIKITTPKDRPHVIRLLGDAAAILRDEYETGNAVSSSCSESERCA